MNDINGIELKVGDIIELFQTVNGESKFVINSIDPIDISYECDTNRKYEYDMNSLLAPSYYTGEVEWEIVGSIIKEVIEPTDVIEENTLKFNPKDLAHIDEMVKHSVGRKALIETATVKHSDNWQDVATPYDICGEMCDLVIGKADKYIVFFSLEFLEVLVCEKGIDPKNITFVGDFFIEAGLAKKMYGVNTTLITKNDVIKNGKFCNEIFTLLTIDKQKEETNNCGEDNMKFNKVAVIANFPYQVPDAGDSTGAKPIYHLFIESVIDNIKPDRTAEDLLFQVMMDWGVDLALPIARKSIQGQEVFFVDDNALAACFDAHSGVDEAFVKELAKLQPLRVVFRDAGFRDSATKINVEQIFRLLSPATEVKCI